MLPQTKEAKWAAFLDLGAAPVKLKCKPRAQGPGVVPGVLYAACANGKVKLVRSEGISDIFDTRGVPVDMIAVRSENSKSVLIADAGHNSLVCPGEKGDIVCLLQDSIKPGALVEVEDTIVYTDGNMLNRFALNDGVVQRLGEVPNVVDLLLVNNNVMCACRDNKIRVVTDVVADYTCVYGSLKLLCACTCSVATEFGEEDVILACCAGTIEGISNGFVAVISSGYVVSRVILPAKDPTCCCVFDDKLLIGFKGYTDIWAADLNEII